jgi:hypothetical protein
VMPRAHAMCVMPMRHGRGRAGYDQPVHPCDHGHNPMSMGAWRAGVQMCIECSQVRIHVHPSNVQRAACGMPRYPMVRACHVQHTAYNMRRATRKVQRAPYNTVMRTLPSVQRAKHAFHHATRTVDHKNTHRCGARVDRVVPRTHTHSGGCAARYRRFTCAGVPGACTGALPPNRRSPPDGARLRPRALRFRGIPS